jgi:hypothetical protein
MDKFEDIIRDIKSAYTAKRLIPFIGSGFSKPLGLPDWGQLVANVARNVGFDPELFTLHGTYPQLLDFIKREYRSEWTNFLHELRVGLDSDNANTNRKASRNHKLLAELDFDTIYTTNYDPHIEKALSENKKIPKVLTSLEDFASTPHYSFNCEVIKFHGDVKKEDTMILTETQYFDRMALEEAVDQRLRADLLSNSFLFIGYSFSDPNIRYIWYKIHKLKSQPMRDNDFELRKSYYVTFGNEPVQLWLLENWDIQVISLDPDNPSKSLFEFLNSLNK